ncbi:dihydrofolate reductase family protein [Microbacterium sp.]|uniref:dihydrofolate reductase family protein n=1 Tax=Microbacterium sp. TaxID=51671 RepID=UPI003A94C727
MHLVTYSMGMSLDGYIVGPDGRFDWSVPSPEVFDHHLDELRETGVHLMGRRLYETMLYWDTADPATLDAAEQEWATRWKALPKVVFSHTLSAVDGENTELATGSLADEIARWRADPRDGRIALGGAGLAAAAAAQGLIDEYRPTIHPVIVGGGTPYAGHDPAQVDLELASARTFDNGVVAARYRVRLGA